MKKGPFKLRSGNTSVFKMMGSSPLKHPGHGGKKEHGHTTLFGTPVEDIGKNIKKVAKNFWEHKDPFPNINLVDYIPKNVTRDAYERGRTKKREEEERNVNREKTIKGGKIRAISPE